MGCLGINQYRNLHRIIIRRFASILLDGEVIKVHEKAAAPSLHSDVPGEGETGKARRVNLRKGQYIKMLKELYQKNAALI